MFTILAVAASQTIFIMSFAIDSITKHKSYFECFSIAFAIFSVFVITTCIANYILHYNDANIDMMSEDAQKRSVGLAITSLICLHDVFIILAYGKPKIANTLYGKAWLTYENYISAYKIIAVKIVLNCFGFYYFNQTYDIVTIFVVLSYLSAPIVGLLDVLIKSKLFKSKFN